MEYIREVTKLGLKPEYLKDMICFNLYLIVCNYYPHYPQPELTLGARRHSDPSFLTILLQDQICGLQVFHENQWIDVHPISGDLVVNIGGFLQDMLLKRRSPLDRSKNFKANVFHQF
ncbi:hypothetical protein CICLE_v10007169mg [Citrus x clementina]|uniref:Fe2OG dioxygenase domain-containing protein n=1 Tax=Citrus clementina TaxID=85681 RepID=V4U2G5_CITCL|nr:hypothetical protein CICLE_v10007169mg [Citrus x clementina]